MQVRIHKVRIPRFSHISTFMKEKLHWLPLSARIQFKIIFLVYKAFLGWAPSYLCKLIMRPLSAISDRPLCSLDHNYYVVPRSRISTSQQCLCFRWPSVVELSPCKNPCSNSLWFIFLYSLPS